MKEHEILIGYEVDTNKAVTTTVDDIRKNRELVEGDSGSGKSHLLTVKIEGTDKKAQRIIIDIEGEYFPLKNNFKFLLLGKSNDIVKVDVDLNLNDVYVEKLAKRLLEKSIDTIIDLSEFPNEATHFISIFFKAILKHSKLMSRPLLIFVDEAHIFAPEKGSGDEESLRAVIEMTKRGRKRGIGVIYGTQEISDFSKKVLRQLRTRFIGQCNYQKDIKMTCEYLGFGKDREQELTTLGEDHQFFVRGAGLKVGGKSIVGIIKIKAIDTVTKLYDFKFEKKVKIKDIDPKAIDDLKNEFGDIAQEINEELSEKEKLEIKVKDLITITNKSNKELSDKNREIQNLKTQLDRKPTVDQKELEMMENNLIYLLNERDQTIKDQRTLLETVQIWLEAYGEGITGKAQKLLEEYRKVPIPEKYKRPVKPTSQSVLSTGPIAKATKETPIKTTVGPTTNFESNQTNSYQDGEFGYSDQELKSKLTGPETKIITATVQRRNNRGSKKLIAFITQYAPNGGAFRNPLSRLRKLNLVNYEGNDLVATEQAIRLFSNGEIIPTDNETVQKYWLNAVSGPESKILAEVLAVYPETISKEECAEKTGYAVNGGAFRNPLSKLKTRELIEYVSGGLKASEELFPNGQ